MVPLGEQKQEEVAQTYKTSCRYVTYSRFGKLCLIVKEYIVILFLKVIKKRFFNVVLKKGFFNFVPANAPDPKE